MRNHNRAVLLRLTETDFLTLKQLAVQHSLTVQEFLRDLLRYGALPQRPVYVPRKEKV